MKLKKGDNVVVIAGKEKGKTGTIIRVFPARNLVVIDKVNIAKRHRRATQAGRKGQIIDIASPIHASNVMIADPKTGKPSRIKIQSDKEGNRSRVAVKSGESIK